ncbi:MAG: pyridoxine 5'-phosphate synthase [Magnetococcales bacterium]|nr:pyridoxine 5'-phosphate synthase [Magnetococcales bacterium]
MIKLGVNVDHVATLRQARGTRFPDPVVLAALAEQAGANSITVHLREDRRHIQERDVKLLLQTIQTRMNLEMAATGEMVSLACQFKPADCCLVPEKRSELTTEGGLNVKGHMDHLIRVVERLSKTDMRVSLFIDPELEQIEAARAVGAPVVELHTGRYAESATPGMRRKELDKIRLATQQAREKGLVVHAGHGLNYHNVQDIAAIPGIEELNIGHAIVARALSTGMDQAIRDMLHTMHLGYQARPSGVAG